MKYETMNETPRRTTKSFHINSADIAKVPITRVEEFTNVVINNVEDKAIITRKY